MSNFPLYLSRIAIQNNNDMSEENQVAEVEAPERKKAKDGFITAFKDKVPILNRAMNAFAKSKGWSGNWNGTKIEYTAERFVAYSRREEGAKEMPSWLWLKSKVAQFEKRG